MKNKPFIEVAVALPVQGSYVYRVPGNLAKAARTGMRALVPFGPRRVTGYLLDWKDGAEGYEARDILELMDDEPLFPETLVPFFRWIAKYYIHPLGEVIRTALPMGLNRHDVVQVSLTAGGAKALEIGEVSEAEKAVLGLLKAKGSRPIKNLADRGQAASMTALVRKMSQKGLVSVSTSLKPDQVRMKTETFVALAHPLPEMGKMSKKRLQILDVVRQHREVSMKSLGQEVPRAPALVSAMAVSGLLVTTTRQVFRDPLGDPVDPDVPPDLTAEQAPVIAQVTAAMGRGFGRYLLSGVTGSGKTEVYLRLVKEALDRGLGALVLVPEISLISQTERRFRARFGERIAVLHSGLTPGEHLDQWNRILSGDAVVVIGARSSIFAPIASPGIIIVDEEHDTSYKQETGLRYNARDLAVVLARIHGIVVMLGSATPSAQSYFNARQGRFRELKLETRVNRSSLPEITLVDLKKYKDHRGVEKLITPELSREIRLCLDRGEQSIIFLNRRGFATYPVCESCGETLKCRFCEITLTLHKEAGQYRCHLCGYCVPSHTKCPQCGSPRIKALGFGTEKIESLLNTLFPDARITRLDQDTAGKKGATVAILKKVRHRTVDIIVGTQMLAKGHDFPFITLVGVVCADLSLNFPDFRAGERTFQLLAQVAGRAGRGERTGKVIMQTYAPDHFSIESARTQDFEEFYLKELPFRQALSYPPFARMIQLIVSGRDRARVEAHARSLGKLCDLLLSVDQAGAGQVQVLGPIEAAIPKINLRYRWQILLKSPSASILNRLVTAMIAEKKTFVQKDISVSIDVDPYFMM
ncbi:MAG: primosomal protein N' [Pseudomonadota bacterium]